MSMKGRVKVWWSLVAYGNETMKYSELCSAFIDILPGAWVKKWCIMKNLKIRSAPLTYFISHFAQVIVEYLNALLSYSLKFMSSSLIEWVVNCVSMEIMNVAMEIMS